MGGHAQLDLLEASEADAKKVPSNVVEAHSCDSPLEAVDKDYEVNGVALDFVWADPWGLELAVGA